MSRPLLLDLFCGAGGAAMGYHRAGFDVVGVDIKPQPHYPFSWAQMDALELLAHFDDVATGIPPYGSRNPGRFDAIHASPPCQAYSVTRSLHDGEYPDLIAPVRTLLRETGLPYVIENVVGAPLIDAVRLCGSSVGLSVWRHRLFESNVPLMVPPCAHPWVPEPIDVTGTGARRLGLRQDGGGGNSRKPESLDQARAALDIGWMTRRELSEAIPPAFTILIGEQLLAQLARAA